MGFANGCGRRVRIQADDSLTVCWRVNPNSNAINGSPIRTPPVDGRTTVLSLRPVLLPIPLLGDTRTQSTGAATIRLMVEKATPAEPETLVEAIRHESR